MSRARPLLVDSPKRRGASRAAFVVCSLVALAAWDAGAPRGEPQAAGRKDLLIATPVDILGGESRCVVTTVFNGLP